MTDNNSNNIISAVSVVIAEVIVTILVAMVVVAATVGLIVIAVIATEALLVNP